MPVITAEIPGSQSNQAKSLGAAFFWLSGFYFVYCIRPEDWIHPLAAIPLAKITGIAAFLAFLVGSSRGKRKFSQLPVEAHYLLAMLGILMISSLVSPVWRGGAVSHTLDFSKVYIVWALTFLLVTDVRKLRRIIFIQAASVPIVCLISLVKGRGVARLDGVLGGIYSNPNDLAFAIVLSLPFCLMFMLTTRKVLYKLLWVSGMFIMLTALFRTGSRGGFITLIAAGVVCLWHFGVKGKRLYLIVISGVAVVVLLFVSGGVMRQRFSSLWDDELDTHQEKVAYESYEQRSFLMQRAIEGIEHYPILGVGTQNFETYSTVWREVHMTYLQIAVEGGIPSLILYLLFFWRGFRNLRYLLKRKDLAPDLKLFTGALHASLIGFGFGALFSPEAYQFFPYFAVAYTSALLAFVKENDAKLKRTQAEPKVQRTELLRPSRVAVHI
ncbi:MAG TPA: O-antigen ligase family protein [Terriglobales bacterium]